MPPPKTTTHRGPGAGRRGQLAASTLTAYAADWGFFTDWCAAAGHTPLPASADTVIDFLDDNPAPPATWARRLAAISHTHTTNNQPSPARDPAVLDLVRAAAGSPALDPHPRRLPPSRLEELVARIPSHGWPAGLHGRRDQLLLVLANAGLTRTQLHQLRVHQLTAADQTLTIHVADRDPIQLPGHGPADQCPACIWLRWRRVLDLAAHYPGNRILRDAFHRTHPVTASSPHPCRTATQPSTDGAGQSVFVPADQYGYLTRDRSLSSRAITRILTTIADEKPPQYRFLTPRPTQTPEPDPPTAPTPPTTRRTPDQIHAAHQEAIARQHRERSRLTQLDAVFDNLNQQIDRLTADAARLATETHPATPATHNQAPDENLATHPRRNQE